MKKLNRMQSIGQFRNIVKHITHLTRFERLGENGKLLYNNNPLPILTAHGTVKIHGTNAGVSYNEIDGMWVQSKKDILTPKKDNAGFAFFVENNKRIFNQMIEEVLNYYEINTKKETITIFGEWAGKGVQGGVGISKLDKKFYIFGLKVKPFDENVPSFWLPTNVLFDNVSEYIYNINLFKLFLIDIDFNNPMKSYNEMVDMVLEVEKECPVAKYFGVSGIGEGIVFEIDFANTIHRFKMKGKKHAGESKVKNVKKIDDKKLQLINDIVEQVTPEWRLSQMYQETFDTINGGLGDIKKTGEYLRAVINDIIKEESDIIQEAGLIPKDINKKISDKARQWMFIKLNEEAGLI